MTFLIYAPGNHKTGSLQSSSVPLRQAVLPPAASSVLCEEVEHPPLAEETAAPGHCFLRQSAAERQQCRFSKQADLATQSGTSTQRKGGNGRKIERDYFKSETHKSIRKVGSLLLLCSLYVDPLFINSFE